MALAYYKVIFLSSLFFLFFLIQGIRELLDLADSTKCKKSVLNECERGSVVLDPWTSGSLAFQRWLQQNLTLDLIQTLGTHNSYNDKTDG